MFINWIIKVSKAYHEFINNIIKIVGGYKTFDNAWYQVVFLIWFFYLSVWNWKVQTGRKGQRRQYFQTELMEIAEAGVNKVTNKIKKNAMNFFKDLKEELLDDSDDSD